MKKTKYTEEKIVAAVKQIEGSRATKDVAREMGVSDERLYNWKAKYGGMEVSDVKRTRALEEKNRRLKEMVTDLSLDKAVPKTRCRRPGRSRRRDRRRLRPPAGARRETRLTCRQKPQYVR